VDNLRQIMQGQTQGELTAEGIRQAERVRDSLASERIDAFYSSDLRRAIDTCAIISAPHGAVEIVQTPLLRERDWGGFTGRFIPSLAGLPWPDDVESEESMRRRAAEFLKMIVRRHANKTVLAVGHGIINKAMQSVLLRKTMREIPKMDNGEIRMLNVEF